MTPRYLVVDDEPLARSRLERLLKEFEPHAVVVQAANGSEAVPAITGSGPWTCVFLDIEMPGLSGLDVVRRVTATHAAPPVVFCTAFPRYAVQAFQESALDYLVKPVEPERLKQALVKSARVQLTRERLVELELRSAGIQAPPVAGTGAGRGTLVFKHGAKLTPVPWSELIFLRADRKLTAAVTVDREYLSDKSLDALAEELPPALFFRCHRAFLINLRHIVSVSGGEEPQVTLRGNHVVPLARRKKSELKAALTGVADP